MIGVKKYSIFRRFRKCKITVVTKYTGKLKFRETIFCTLLIMLTIQYTTAF
jgi:hypothetical protein